MQNYTTNQYFFFFRLLLFGSISPNHVEGPMKDLAEMYTPLAFSTWRVGFGTLAPQSFIERLKNLLNFYRYDFLFIRKHIFMRTIIHLHFIFFCVHISHVQLGICNTVSILNTIIFLYFINCCILSTFFSLHLGVSWIIFPGINFY